MLDLADVARSSASPAGRAWRGTLPWQAGSRTRPALIHLRTQIFKGRPRARRLRYRDVAPFRDLFSLTNQTRMVSMTTASISELKANLSRYVDEVRRGGEVQILDRGMPVARLVPTTAGGDPKALERLVSRGLIRSGKGDPAAALKEPPLELSVSILDALLEDRDDRL